MNSTSFLGAVSLSISLILSSAASAGVCTRSPAVVAALELSTQKKCASIESADLALISKLRITRQISFLFQDFDGLVGLTQLQVAKADIDQIPSDVFKPLIALKNLQFKYVNFKNGIPADLFKATPGLTHLEIYVTDLKQLDARQFEGLINLESLIIYENVKLESLPPLLFKDLNRVKTLGLNENRLSTISADTFLGLSALESLNLDENLIETIDPTAFETIPLCQISLQRNLLSPELQNEIKARLGDRVVL